MFEELRGKVVAGHFLTDKEEIVRQLAKLLRMAVEQGTHVGIAFSGGLDSCLMALLSKNATLYSVGTHGSKDLVYARRAAEFLGKRLKVKVLTFDQAEFVVSKVVEILRTAGAQLNPVNVSVGCVTYAVLQLARTDNARRVLTGLGSEDLFAGYDWHTDYRENYDPAHIQETLWKSFHELDERDLKRDAAIARNFGIELVTPFLDPMLVEYGMRIHPSLKVRREEKKIILRETALRLGLPREFACQQRRAAQYGSGFDKVLLKLAKLKRLQRKRDYVNSI